MAKKTMTQSRKKVQNLKADKPLGLKKALIVFIKNPEEGRVKTRLAASVGAPQALEVYKKLLEHTRNTVIQTDCNKFLFYDRVINLEDGWSNADFEKCLQSPGDLGQKMSHAFQFCFEQKSQDSCVIIGSDCPEINSEIITKAFNSLKQYDFCIGPSYDGGYYLLGMRCMNEAVFHNIKWSTDQVLKQTVSSIQQLNKSYTLLDTLHDLDNIEDLERFPEFKA